MRPYSGIALCALLALGQSTPAQITKQVGPAVVAIRASGPSGESSGSGFIVDSSGTVVTNLHVIEGATSLAIRLPNGDIYDQVRVKSYDARRDLAVIQIPGYGMPTVALADSDSVQPGQPVVLIGNALGMLEGSVSAGIISGVRDSGGVRVIQTDAAANKGNSGGPLLDSSGKAIGVLSFKMGGAENLNFAVPINYVRGLLATGETFPLAELSKRLSNSTDLFAGRKPDFPTRWRSLVSGTTKIIRVDGDRVYVETPMPDDQRQAGAFNISELVKKGDRWVGVGRIIFMCSWSPIIGNGPQVNRCEDIGPIEITSMSPTRIEGITVANAEGAKFDCKKCTWNKKPVRSEFAWIPE